MPNPEIALKHGNDFPFDAPDSWWNADEVTPASTLPAVDWSTSAARGIIADLQDRRGIKHELEVSKINQEIRTDIVQSLAAIIRAAAAQNGTS